MKEYNEFINEKENDKSPLTIKAYRFSIENFLNDLHLETVDQIARLTANDYRNYRENLLSKPLSKVSVNSHFRNISSFINWLYNYEYIKELPSIRKVKALKQTKRLSLLLMKMSVLLW
jgi:site-specific recombinase XerD